MENNGKPPLTYNRLRDIVRALGSPKKPIPAPTLEDMKSTSIFLHYLLKLSALMNVYLSSRLNWIKCFSVLDVASFSEKHKQEYGIPSLEELGLDTSSLTEEIFPGGEQEALRRLDKYMQRTVSGFLMIPNPFFLMWRSKPLRIYFLYSYL